MICLVLADCAIAPQEGLTLMKCTSCSMRIGYGMKLEIFLYALVY